MVTNSSKACVFLGVALSTVLCAAAAAAADCESWMRTVSQYDARVDGILEGQEVEHLLTLLRRAQDPASAPRSGALPQLARLVETRVEQLGDVDPPVELAALHRKLIEFHRAVLDAAVRPPVAAASASQPPDRECYRTLLAYFEQLYGDLVAHGCDGGDAEALQQRMIPQLRAILAAPPPDGD